MVPGRSPIRHQLRAPDSYSIQRSSPGPHGDCRLAGGARRVPSRTARRGSVKRYGPHGGAAVLRLRRSCLTVRGQRPGRRRGDVAGRSTPVARSLSRKSGTGPAKMRSTMRRRRSSAAPALLGLHGLLGRIPQGLVVGSGEGSEAAGPERRGGDPRHRPARCPADGPTSAVPGPRPAAGEVLAARSVGRPARPAGRRPRRPGRGTRRPDPRHRRARRPRARRTGPTSRLRSIRAMAAARRRAAQRRLVLGQPVLERRLGGGEQLVPDGEGRVVAAHDLAHHQADELLDLEHRLQDVVQQVGQRRRRGPGPGTAGGRRVVDEAPLLEHGHQQVPLGGEVVVERGHVEAGGGGQVAHAGPVHPLLGHEGQRRARGCAGAGSTPRLGATGSRSGGGHGSIVDRWAARRLDGLRARAAVVPNERLVYRCRAKGSTRAQRDEGVAP